MSAMPRLIVLMKFCQRDFIPLTVIAHWSPSVCDELMNSLMALTAAAPTAAHAALAATPIDLSDEPKPFALVFAWSSPLSKSSFLRLNLAHISPILPIIVVLPYEFQQINLCL